MGSKRKAAPPAPDQRKPEVTEGEAKQIASRIIAGMGESIRMKAPAGTGNIGVIGTDGKHYQISCNDQGVCTVPRVCVTKLLADGLRHAS
jgi:hypothetical protein